MESDALPPPSQEVRTATRSAFLRHYPSDGFKRACDEFRAWPTAPGAYRILGAAALTAARHDARLETFAAWADFEGTAAVFVHGELAEEPNIG